MRHFTEGWGFWVERGEKVGIVESKLDTSIIKKSIRDYLKQCGWKKAGLFG